MIYVFANDVRIDKLRMRCHRDFVDSRILKKPSRFIETAFQFSKRISLEFHKLFVNLKIVQCNSNCV
jgi:hypothetical protein